MTVYLQKTVSLEINAMAKFFKHLDLFFKLFRKIAGSSHNIKKQY